MLKICKGSLLLVAASLGLGSAAPAFAQSGKEVVECVASAAVPGLVSGGIAYAITKDEEIAAVIGTIGALIGASQGCPQGQVLVRVTNEEAFRRDHGGGRGHGPGRGHDDGGGWGDDRDWDHGNDWGDNDGRWDRDTRSYSTVTKAKRAAKVSAFESQDRARTRTVQGTRVTVTPVDFYRVRRDSCMDYDMTVRKRDGSRSSSEGTLCFSRRNGYYDAN